LKVTGSRSKGSAKEKWGRLTDDDIEAVAAKKDQFVGKLQQRYGYTREEAERQLDTWIGDLEGEIKVKPPRP
jgi:uncharacterized protein YjbJ (UPF0337 family)